MSDTEQGSETKLLYDTLKKIIEAQTALLRSQQEERERDRSERAAEAERIKTEMDERMQKDLDWRLQELALCKEELKRTEEKEKELESFMKQQEEQRRAHELQLMEKQKELQTLKSTKDRKLKLAEKIEVWKDKDQPDTYLTRFKRVMKEVEIPEEEWPQRLIPLLTGKVLSAYTNNVPTSATEKYETSRSTSKSALSDLLQVLR